MILLSFFSHRSYRLVLDSQHNTSFKSRHKTNTTYAFQSCSFPLSPPPFFHLSFILHFWSRTLRNAYRHQAATTQQWYVLFKIFFQSSLYVPIHSLFNRHYRHPQGRPYDTENLEVSCMYIRRFSYSSRKVSFSIQEFFLCFLSFLISVPFSTLGEHSGGTTVHTISADVAFHSSQSTSHPPDCFLSRSLDFALCDSSPASPMKDELYKLQWILLCLPRDTLSRAHKCLGLVLRIRLEELRMEGKKGPRTTWEANWSK